ncbi:unnamed protein product [Prunus armeniaca]
MSSRGFTIMPAWKSWREGTGANLIDPTMGTNSRSEEVMRCVGANFVPLEYSPKIPSSSLLFFLPAKQIEVRGPHPAGVGQRPSDA